MRLSTSCATTWTPSLPSSPLGPHACDPDDDISRSSRLCSPPRRRRSERLDASPRSDAATRPSWHCPAASAELPPAKETRGHWPRRQRAQSRAPRCRPDAAKFGDHGVVQTVSGGPAPCASAPGWGEMLRLAGAGRQGESPSGGKRRVLASPVWLLPLADGDSFIWVVSDSKRGCGLGCCRCCCALITRAARRPACPGLPHRGYDALPPFETLDISRNERPLPNSCSFNSSLVSGRRSKPVDASPWLSVTSR